MSGAFNAKRTRRKPTINITSLIDVMFLLLIFFMVSSTFREQYGIDVALPRAQSAEVQEALPGEITVNRNGEVYYGDQRVDETGLRQHLRERLAVDPEAAFVLRADEEADFGAVVQVIDIARTVGAHRLSISTHYSEVSADGESSSTAP